MRLINITEKIKLEIQVIEWLNNYSSELYEIRNYNEYMEGQDLTIGEMLELLQDLQNHNGSK